MSSPIKKLLDLIADNEPIITTKGDYGQGTPTDQHRSGVHPDT